MGDLSSPESKLSWIFTAFDADGGGTIDAQEIRLKIAMAQMFMCMKRMIFRDIVVGLFHLAGIEEDEDLLYSCTEDVRLDHHDPCLLAPSGALVVIMG